MNEEKCSRPLGKVFGDLARAYADAFTERLKDLPIDRYFYALVVIQEYEGDLSQSTLADELLIDKAVVVRMLDYLEERNCIIRETHPSDRRAHILRLTDRALEMIPRIKEAISETNAICTELARESGLGNLYTLFERMGAELITEGSGTYKLHFVRKDEHEK